MFRGKQKVFPETIQEPEVQLVELRPGRRLRVRCLSILDRYSSCQRNISNVLDTRETNAAIANAAVNNAVTLCEDNELVNAADNQKMPTSGSNLSKDAVNCNRDHQRAGENTGGNESADDLDVIIVFLLHGVGGSIEIWNSQIDFFLNQVGHCRVIAVDFLGHGYSSAPNESMAYNFSELAEDVIELFDRFHGRRNVVVGHSYGCSFAVLLARRYNTLVSKLILISGGNSLPLSPEPGIFLLPECILNCFRPALRKFYLRRLFYGWDDSLVNLIVVPPTYVLKYTMMGQWWPEGDVEFHSKLDVDTLLIHGRQDSLISVTEAEQTHKTVQKSELKIVEDAGHMVMMEKPDEVNDYLRVFLSQELAR